MVTLPTDERALGVPRCCCKRDRGRQSFDRIDFGHADLLDQAPRIRRDRFEVAPLRFGVKRAECQRRFARARHAGEHHQRIARNLHVDVLQIVLAGAAYADKACAGAGRRAGRTVFPADGVHVLGDSGRVRWRTMREARMRHARPDAKSRRGVFTEAADVASGCWANAHSLRQCVASNSTGPRPSVCQRPAVAAVARTINPVPAPPSAPRRALPPDACA